MKWILNNLKLNTWLIEVGICEKFGQKPEGLFVDLKKTVFIIEFTSATNEYLEKEMKKLKSGN